MALVALLAAIGSVAACYGLTTGGSPLPLDSRPIRKVISLLEDMKKQVEKDASADQTAHEKFMCWCETTEKEKTAAIDSANEHIEELEPAIESAVAKQGQLRTEIVGFGEGIAADGDAVSSAAGVRAKESKASQKEQADMKLTHKLLAQAIEVLSKVQLVQRPEAPEASALEAQAGATDAAEALLQVKQIVRRRRDAPQFANLLRRDLYDVLGSLTRVAKGHSEQLSLIREVASLEQLGASAQAKPNDLVGNAAGAESYGAQSSGILGALKAMLDDITKDLLAAQKEDLLAEIEFQNLRATKLAEASTGRRQKDRKELSLAEVKDQEAQAREDKETTAELLAEDQAFVANLQRKCKAEEESYQSRSKMRSEEARALSEALAMLTEDVARDLYAKTMSLVQLHAGRGTSASQQRTAMQENALRRSAQLVAGAAHRHRSWTLAFLASRMRIDAFIEVKAHLDKSLTQLRKQQKEEYEKGEFCKKEIDKTEDNIKDKQNTKEDLSETHQALANEIATIQNEIDGFTTEVAEMQVSLKKAGEDRKAQNRLFQASFSDQRAMISVLKKVTARLAAFYAFGQQAAHTGAEALQEPQPPSAKGYQKAPAAAGVLALLNMIVKDAVVEEQDLQMSEQRAQKDYASFVQDTTASIAAARGAIKKKLEGMAAAQAEQSDVERAQLSNDEDISKFEDLLQAHHLDCDFLLKYFDVRQKARSDETEAISDAKAILSGASYGQ